MKFIYGKRDWATARRGQENCYLMTNGLGGYSSAAMTGANTRSDHALLMACTRAPDCRYNMVHRLKEELDGLSSPVCLSSQEYVGQVKEEEGFFHLSSFQFEDYPKWVFHAYGVEVVKELAMKQGENLVAVKYMIDNRTAKRVILKVTPYLQFTPKGSPTGSGKNFSIQEGALGEGRISGGGLALYFRTNGRVQCFEQQLIEGMYYGHDDCDGRFCEGKAYVNHHVILEVEANGEDALEIIYSMEKITESADNVIRDAISYRRELACASGFKDDMAAMLAKSAAQFVARRDSTGGQTIMAGFPHFGDWGRDTMIALAGCCISTGQTQIAKSILRTFAAYCKDGLMPNLFPEGQKSPQYNTADASLLFINAVYLFVERTHDMEFLEEMLPVMEDIVRCYQKGTSYGIHMDADGLIMAGEGLDQVTWMDVRIGDILPTPRHGKPVEINAYWYNALRIMAQYSGPNGDSYAKLADKAKESFCEKFWNEKKGCLKDVISGTGADDQIRCNQIWAVSMPFSILDETRERQVVDTVFEKLYTPYGLRTLEMTDSQFHGSYGGPQNERDLAYHQGTVWVFPLGAYYLAYLKTRGHSKEAKEKVRNQLELLEGALREGCIGQLPEIYDGANPSFSKGCFAQAWSVGEILRVYEVLGKDIPALCETLGI